MQPMSSDGYHAQSSRNFRLHPNEHGTENWFRVSSSLLVGPTALVYLNVATVYRLPSIRRTLRLLIPQVQVQVQILVTMTLVPV